MYIGNYVYLYLGQFGDTDTGGPAECLFGKAGNLAFPRILLSPHFAARHSGTSRVTDV